VFTQGAAQGEGTCHHLSRCCPDFARRVNFEQNSVCL
jgi:hypothetical protein